MQPPGGQSAKEAVKEQTGVGVAQWNEEGTAAYLVKENSWAASASFSKPVSSRGKQSRPGIKKSSYFHTLSLDNPHQEDSNPC